MRTTVTIPDDLMAETMKISGKERKSEAVVTSLREYVSLKKRLSLLHYLLENPVPHRWAGIKRDRRGSR